MASAKTKKLHTMKETCELTGMAYENLKYYCNTGLVPNVKRSANNRRVFDDHDVAWIKSLTCLKKCGMTIEEMKQYLAYCLQGPASIPVRKVMLEKKLAILEEKKKDIQESIDYIGWKQNFYNDVLSGKRPYISDLLPEYNDDDETSNNASKD
ncbi:MULTISPECIES: MerR family transcriptional regulator [Megasphaera]|uniref:MerR family transcriptional regulator n=1 Tax=Megasphaera TaxID=906 RepID=UPI000922DC3F|nr:MerR family transcriptional regulator [Megasphaera elsdenii]MDY4728042.1 MerR family transcriptional regulator [Megasphaera elsdenii]SHK15811.1 DNA-binding transcriptional regulator, MerR family [Megasphaera elsdenii]